MSRLSRKNEMRLHKHSFSIDDNYPTYYYADFTKCIMNKDHCINSEGIYKIGSSNEKDANFNIAGICEFAIINLEKYYKTQDKKALYYFEQNVSWLVKNANIIGNKAYWYYNYDMGPHKGSWASCISQGMAISALVRAAVFYDDNNYIELAKKGAQPIITPIYEGGFKYCTDSFKNWYEESCENTHILNGHIFALLGVYDLYRVTNNKMYLTEFTTAVNSIKENLDEFDLGFASTYDAKEKIIANNSYHIINTNLIAVLYDITKDNYFLNLHIRWNKIFTSKKIRFYAFLHTLLAIINLKISLKWKH
jgi:heparosan-N-sulfate-glucuronate 5-epimerase